MSNNKSNFSEAELKEPAAKKIEENARERGEHGPTPGVPLNFSVDIFELLNRIPSDPAIAMKALEMLAQHLRERTLPHPMLADHIADAIEVAAAKPPKYHARALTDELHLTSQDRRPAGPWINIGNRMYTLIGSGISQTKAKNEVAAEYDIDPSTALNYYKQYMKAKQANDSIE